MKKASALFIVSLIVSIVHAQSNTFKLTDSVFTLNSVYTCPALTAYNPCSNKFNDGYVDSFKIFLRSHPTIKIKINWYTDQRGSAQYNQILTEKYVEHLKLMIVDSTISADRITIVGMGESKPLVNSATIDSYKTEREKELAYEKNRRIEIVILKL